MKTLPPPPPDMPRCPHHPLTRPVAVRVRPGAVDAVWTCLACDTVLGPTIKPLTAPD